MMYAILIHFYGANKYSYPILEMFELFFLIIYVYQLFNFL